MSRSTLYTAFCLALTGCVAGGSRNTPIPSEFVAVREVEIGGDEQRPLLTVARPAIIGNQLYLSDFTGHRIHVVDLARGEIVRTIGTGGEGPGEFNLPYGVVLAFPTGGSPQYVVNDKGNSRLQIFDSEWTLIDTVPVTSQADRFVYFEGEQSAGRGIRLYGFAPCGSRECLVQDIGLDGRVLRSFVEIPTSTPMYTWEVGTLESEMTFAANSMEAEVHFYDDDGRLAHSIDTETTRTAFPQYDGVSDPENPFELIRWLRSNAYTSIRRIVDYKGNILVQHERKNYPPDSAKFFVDVYSPSGELLTVGLQTDGLVIDVAGETIRQIQTVNEGFGSVRYFESVIQQQP